MPLIAETGAIVANANTYATRAVAATYHTDRGNGGWATLAAAGAPLEAAQDALLLRAAEMLDRSFAWRGSIVSGAQAMRWPREGVTDRDGREIASDAIPTAIVAAQCELALLLSAGAGVGGAAGSIAAGPMKRVKAGSVEVEWTGRAGAVPAAASNVLPNGAGEYLDRILFGLFAAPGGVMVKLGKS